MPKFATATWETVRLSWIMGARDFALIGVGSRLGRWWPTIGLAIRISFVGSIFGLVLGSRPGDYVPWLATGWAVWGMISSTVTGTTTSLEANRGMILSLALPREVFPIKVVVRELILLSQNALLVVAVILLAGVNVSYEMLLVIPGLLLTILFLVGMGLILAPLGAKYRDIGPLISSLIGVMFFILPIMWKPDSIQSDFAHLILGLNPFYHYLQIVRLPLLGEAATIINYGLAALGAAISVSVGLLVLKRTRERSIYWV